MRDDVIIIGSGVSGLLLARSLLARGAVRRLRVVGPTQPSQAHRLSYWSDLPTPFDGSADAEWSAVRLLAPDGTPRQVELGRYRYRTLQAQPWLSRLRAELARSHRVEFLETPVDAVADRGEHATVSAGGDTLTADWVFSSGRRTEREPARWQHFEGWELELPEGASCEPVPTLLDFRTAQAAGDFRFLYALPLGPRRLFLEHVSYQPCDHAAALETALRELFHLEGWHLSDREGGATPLFEEPPPAAHGRVVDIGVSGGLAKACTGYALTRMWRDAELIAAGLAEAGSPQRLGSPLLGRAADALFLELLEHSPQRLPPLLEAIFAKAPGDAVLAFLDDRARAEEQLQIGAAVLPSWLR